MTQNENFPRHLEPIPKRVLAHPRESGRDSSINLTILLAGRRSTESIHEKGGCPRSQFPGGIGCDGSCAQPASSSYVNPGFAPLEPGSFGSVTGASKPPCGTAPW